MGIDIEAYALQLWVRREREVIVTLLDTLIQGCGQAAKHTACILRELEREFIRLSRLDILDYATLIYRHLLAILVLEGADKVPIKSIYTLGHNEVARFVLGIREFYAIIRLNLHAVTLVEALCDSLVEDNLDRDILHRSNDIYRGGFATLNHEWLLATEELLRSVECCRDLNSALHYGGVVALQQPNILGLLHIRLRGVVLTHKHRLARLVLED